MDESVQIFHQICRMHWNSYNCPVCFCISKPDLMKNSVCMKCDVKDSLWYCTICGHIGCGRLVNRHAVEHYKETKHRWVMGLKKFVVWDYQDRKYLHKINGSMQIVENCCTYIQKNAGINCSCPVCQNNRYPKLLKQSACMTCEESQVLNLWACLSCGHIGCANNEYLHALKHYKTTKHPRVMRLDNYSIWDYKDQKYVHTQFNGSLAVMRGDSIVSTKIENNYPNYSQVEIVNTDTAITTTARFFNEEELPKAAELLQQQQVNFAKRINRLEHLCEEFGKLTDTSNKMIEIEKSLLNLTDGKKVFEQTLYEHEKKLNELLARSPPNGKNSSSIESNDVENMTSNALTTITLNTLNCAAISPEARSLHNNATQTNSDSNSNKSQFISIIILGLFVYYLLKLSLQKLFENM